MPYTLKDKLVIGISTRALFDLSEANDVFEREGLEAYERYQLEREREQLAPGTGFALVKAFLAINEKAGRPLIDVVLISRNSAESGLRVFNSIEAYGLSIERGAFRGGRDPWSVLRGFNCSLFLSAEPAAVVEALRAGVPAALALAPPAPADEPTADISEVRIAFDGDAVLFTDSSEQVYQREGLEAFQEHELDRIYQPMDPGPFAPFLRALSRVQAEFPPGESPIRTALVTARNAPAHKRVIHTLRSWGVRVDEAYFLGGMEKTPVLEVFKPHIYFDDQTAHLEAARATVPSAHVITEARQLAVFESIPELSSPLSPVVVIPPIGRSVSNGANRAKRANGRKGAKGAKSAVGAKAGGDAARLDGRGREPQRLASATVAPKEPAATRR
ncbi:MAG TPA: 5'-nucleotidase [Candidatus Limnocylindrales bacterium]|nr:5'-nucleotidase [Candidatus Limnocylindrales bacterium]